jgi:thioesterase domain-containing protein/acyl carrier protein
VGEHRFRRSGSGLFPGTGYIEMILNAAREAIPVDLITIRDLHFKRPLEAAPGEPQRVRTELRRNGSEYVFTASAKTSEGWSECASARVIPEGKVEKPAANLATIRRRCGDRSIVFAHRQNRLQETAFDFGPRWHTLDRIDFGQQAALAAVELAPEFISDLDSYKVHPALLDMATAAAMFLIPGYENSRSVYVPMGYGRIRVQRPLPARCYSYLHPHQGLSADSPIATFDAEILDDDGNLLIEISEFMLRRLDQDLKLTRQAVQVLPANGDVEGKANHQKGTRDRISSSEGVAAFARLLKGAYAANVVVFPSDFNAFTPASRYRGAVSRAAMLTDVGVMHNEVETTIAEWWRELLGAQTFTPQSDFFQLGGQSLTAVRLFAKIKKTYGVQLSPATIYEARTIEKLARCVRNSDTREVATKSTLVPIRSEGSRPPLYLFPGVGGTVVGFDSLLRRLPDDLPVYGAESTWIARPVVPLRVEEMAAIHLGGIRSLQKHGPYFLLGHSFGGLVAFEVAQQLVAAGETIGMLGMLDTWQVGHIRDLNTKDKRSQKLARRAGKAMVHLSRLCAGPDRLAYFQNYMGSSRRSLVSTMYLAMLSRYLRSGRPLPRILRAPNQVNLFASLRYVAQPYPGRITMFRATGGITLEEPRYGEFLGWQNIAQGGVEVCEVPGNHKDILLEPNVQILAREVAAVCVNSEPLRAVRRTDGTNEAVAG